MKITINLDKEYEATSEQVAEIEKILAKKITYQDIEMPLRTGSPSFWANNYAYISKKGEELDIVTEDYSPYFSSKKQMDKIVAINKLLNVAKYLNGDWQPDFRNYDVQFYELYSLSDNFINICPASKERFCTVYFKTEELAKQAIEILGFDTIMLALSTDY